MENIYYNAESNEATNSHFQSAGYVISTNPDSWTVEAIEKEQRFDFSVNSYCAIAGWKLFNTIFSGLAMEMSGDKPFEAGEETTILPRGLKDAAKRLRAFAETVTQKEADADLKWKVTETADYRIVIDLNELKETLLALAGFIEETAKEAGMMAEFWV